MASKSDVNVQSIQMVVERGTRTGESEKFQNPEEKVHSPIICARCNKPLLNVSVNGSDNKSFCSQRCLKRDLFKAEYQRRAEIYARQGLPIRKCALNSFPGKSCGMLALINENSSLLPEDNEQPIYFQMEYCGKAHNDEGRALASADQAELQAQAILKRIEDVKAGCAMKVRTYTTLLRKVSSGLMPEQLRSKL
jgi:hypothetical protein